MQVNIRHPGISVLLFKNVGRTKLSGSGANALPVSTRFSGQNKVVDLTDFLGEQGQVTVSKSVREPAGGFSIELTDQIIAQSGDSLYGLVEPMDVVEIRMTGNAQKGKPPIMMRGFVSRVTRSESITANGQPSRKVILSGQDYGKIWQIRQVVYNPWMPASGNLITQFPFFARFGGANATMAVDQFVKQVFTTILNPFIKSMSALSGDPTTSPLLPIGVDTQFHAGVLAPNGVNDWGGGTIYSLFQEFCDIGPWNELYIEDRESGPVCVYRQNPFLTADGKGYILSNSTAPAITSITRDDVISMDASRSDDDIANYYWVSAPRYDLNYDSVAKAMAGQGGHPETFYIQNYGNVDPKLYGQRKMETMTAQGSPGELTGGNGTNKTQGRDSQNGLAIDWMSNRRAALVKQNRDNVVFETGSMQIKGNESVKAGSYLSLKHGNMVSKYYVPSVQHSYRPFAAYTTSVNFERGTGFIDRVQQGGGPASPYWSELVDAQS